MDTAPSSTLDKSSISLWEARNNGSTSLSTDSSILPRFSLPQPQNMPSHTRNLFCFPSPRQSSQLLCTLPAVRTKHLYTAVVLEGTVPCRQCTVSSAEAEATTTTKIRNPEKKVNAWFLLCGAVAVRNSVTAPWSNSCCCRVEHPHCRQGILPSEGCVVYDPTSLAIKASSEARSGERAKES